MLTGRDEMAIDRAKPRGEFFGVGEPDRLTLSSSVMCCTMFPWNSAGVKKKSKYLELIIHFEYLKKKN